jgi:mannose-6-phosphate isomerase-like protein (cupin superfamily)
MQTIDFRESHDDFHILETTSRSQCATMCLQPGEATGDELEAHPKSDQVVIVLNGEFLVELDDDRGTVRAGQSITIHAGTKHRLSNPGDSEAFAFTVYAPPAYPEDEEEQEETAEAVKTQGFLDLTPPLLPPAILVP